MKRRPNAQDRDLADYIRRLPVGSSLTVEKTPEIVNGFGLAALRIEGSLSFRVDGRDITIIMGR